MIKGRRTRNAGKNSVLNSDKMNLDDTASPKRKDSKCNVKSQPSQAVAVQLTKKHPSHVRESIMLRTARMKNVDISCYLQATDRSKSATAIMHLEDEKIIDITDENSCDTFTMPSSESLEVHSPNEQDEHSAIRKATSYNNNNIFLQEPVLSLNIDKTSAEPTHTLKIMQTSISNNTHLKTGFFSSLSQPKLGLWKNASMTTMCNNNILRQQKAAIKDQVHNGLDLSKPTQVTHIDSTTATTEMLLHHDDSNSCDSGDSGVVLLSRNNGATSSLPTEASEASFTMVEQSTDSAEKRKKPATPHRILCPSHNKHTDVGSSLENESKMSTPGYSGNKKTRKRLNVRDAEQSPVIYIPDNPLNLHNLLQTKNDKAEDLQSHEGSNITRDHKLAQKPRDLTIDPRYVKSGNGGSKKITEFYPVRRSVRKTKKEVQVQRDKDIEHAILEGREEGLKIQHFEGKGRGIVTTRAFCKGEFVVEYIGDLISVSEAKQREQIYAEDDNTGCYMYYFKHKNIQYCIDATAESGKLGRLVNHSRNGNLVTKTVSINNRPHLVLISKEDIDVGVEVTYDYGDRSKEALQYYPWLAL